MLILAGALGKLGFGKAVSKPSYEFIAAGGAQLPPGVKNGLRWLGGILPSIAPGRLMDSKHTDASDPALVYMDATGKGG